MYPQYMFLSENKKIVKKKSNEICHFHGHEKSLYVAWACFHNVINELKNLNQAC